MRQLLAGGVSECLSERCSVQATERRRKNCRSGRQHQEAVLRDEGETEGICQIPARNISCLKTAVLQVFSRVSRSCHGYQYCAQARLEYFMSAPRFKKVRRNRHPSIDNNFVNSGQPDGVPPAQSCKRPSSQARQSAPQRQRKSPRRLGQGLSTITLVAGAGFEPAAFRL